MLRVLLDQVQSVGDRASMLPLLADDRLRDVQTLVQADLTSSPTLAQIGQRIGVGERTLSRLFRDVTGMGYTVWRNQVRLHEANLLLAQGRSVTQVATACGYSSPSAFISTVRAAFGRTPGSLYPPRSR